MQNNTGDIIGGIALLCLVFIPAFIVIYSYWFTPKLNIQKRKRIKFDKTSKALLFWTIIWALVGAMAWAGTTKTIASSGKSYCKILTIEVNK